MGRGKEAKLNRASNNQKGSGSRAAYLCLYCRQLNRINQHFSSRNINGHVKTSHRTILSDQNISLLDFKAVEGRDFEKTSHKIQEFEKPDAKPQMKIKTEYCRDQINYFSRDYDSYESGDEKMEIEKQQFNEVLNKFQDNGFLNQLEKVNITPDRKPDFLCELNEQLQCKQEMINHLIKCQQIQKQNKKAEKVIIDFVTPDNKNKKVAQKIKAISNSQVSIIEFSQQNLQHQIQVYKNNLLDNNLQKQHTVNKFINKCFNYLLELVEEVLNYLYSEQQMILSETIQQIQQQNQADFQQIREQIHEERQQYDKIFETYQGILEKLDENLEKNLKELNKIPSIPINADLTKKGFCKSLSSVHQKIYGQKFSAVAIDYAWPIDFKTESGNQFIPYNTLSMKDLYELEIEDLQDQGYLFMWTVAQKFVDAIAFMLLKGYRIVDSICWVKKGQNKKYKKRPGYHVRHSKEICLIGLKGNVPPTMNSFTADDIIETIPGKNSAKPEALKDIIEKMCPGGHYLELFARENNLRVGWVSVGNEI